MLLFRVHRKKKTKKSREVVEDEEEAPVDENTRKLTRDLPNLGLLAD